MKQDISLLLFTLALFLPSAWANDLGVFAGNRSLSDDQLLTSLKRNISEFNLLLLYKPGTAERMAQSLERIYKQQGFPLASVVVEKGQGNPTLRISEGPRASLGLVQFQGNHLFSNQHLLESASLDDYFESDEVEKGLGKIRRVYRDEGYASVEVGPVLMEIVEVEKKDHFPVPFSRQVANQVRLTIPIKEGPKYYYGAVYLPKELLDAELRPPERGEVYREQDLLLFR